MKKITKVFEIIFYIIFGILFIIPAIIVVLIDAISNKIFLSKQFKKIKNAGYKISKTKSSADSIKENAEEKSKSPYPSEFHNVTKVYIRVPDFNCDLFKKARNIVEIFEGDKRVIFYDSSNSKAVNFPLGIDATPYVISELISLLGKENVVPK